MAAAAGCFLGSRRTPPMSADGHQKSDGGPDTENFPGQVTADFGRTFHSHLATPEATAGRRLLVASSPVRRRPWPATCYATAVVEVLGRHRLMGCEPVHMPPSQNRNQSSGPSHSLKMPVLHHRGRSMMSCSGGGRRNKGIGPSFHHSREISGEAHSPVYCGGPSP